MSNFNTSKVNTMRFMFAESKATNLDLSNFNTSNVTDMYRMFIYCKATSIDVSNFDTNKVTSAGGMFRECLNLIKLDLSSFTMPNCTDISWMFGGSQKIEEINLSNF